MTCSWVNARFFLGSKLTWISERLISDCDVPPMVTSVSLTPLIDRSLVAIDSLKDSLTAKADPVEFRLEILRYPRVKSSDPRDVEIDAERVSAVLKAVAEGGGPTG